MARKFFFFYISFVLLETLVLFVDMVKWFDSVWLDNSDCYQVISSALKPVSFGNDFIIEISRRIGSISITSYDGYWTRQTKEKKRTISKSNSESSLMSLYFNGTLKSNNIDPIIETLRKESIDNTIIDDKIIITNLEYTHSLDNRTCVSKYHSFIKKFIANGGLNLLSSLLIGPYSRSPWEPLLHCFVYLIEYSRKFPEILPNDSLLTLLSNSKGKNLPTLLDIVFDQTHRISSSTSLEFNETFLNFWNSIMGFCDINWVQKVLQKYVCEVLLKPLVTIQTIEDKSDEIIMPKQLRELVDTHNTPLIVI